MGDTLLIVGVACIIAAVVGGGFKGLGVQIPIVSSATRQLALAALGLILVAVGIAPRLAPDEIQVNSVLSEALADYDQGDYDSAIEKFGVAARAGSAEAQYHLGEMLWHGEGVVPSVDEAAKWIQNSADAGYAPAQASLGRAYYQGDGMETNHETALLWLERAASQGYAPADYLLGRLALESDTAMAITRLLRAAEAGVVQAQYALFSLSTWGESTTVAARGVNWGRRAALQGHREAQFWNAYILYSNSNGDREVLWDALFLAKLAESPRDVPFTNGEPDVLIKSQNLQDDILAKLGLSDPGTDGALTRQYMNILEKADAWEPDLERVYRHGH